MSRLPRTRATLPKPAFYAMALTTGAFVLSALARVLGAPIHDLVLLGLCVSAMAACLIASIVTLLPSGGCRRSSL